MKQRPAFKQLVKNYEESGEKTTERFRKESSQRKCQQLQELQMKEKMAKGMGFSGDMVQSMKVNFALNLTNQNETPKVDFNVKQRYSGQPTGTSLTKLTMTDLSFIRCLSGRRSKIST